MVNINARILFFLFFLIFTSVFIFSVVSGPVDFNFNSFLKQIWFFNITHYDYYLLFNSYGLIDLNIAKEIYYHFNAFEFFLINFVVLYGIIASILGLFCLRRVLVFATLNSYLNAETLTKMNITYFIRTQNFIKQKTTTAGSRVWYKQKTKF